MLQYIPCEKVSLYCDIFWCVSVSDTFHFYSAHCCIAIATVAGQRQLVIIFAGEASNHNSSGNIMALKNLK